MFEYKVNYYNSTLDNFKAESRLLEDTLEGIGLVKHLGGTGRIVQFSLFTDQEMDQVRHLTNLLELDGEVTVNLLEDENAY